MSQEPKRFDEFVIESMIGEGGMGKVYRARQTALDRWVALKVLPRAKENPSFTERFYREARSAARLVHPNIIQIHTVGEIQGVPYYTMEYVEGVDLEHIVHDREHPLGRDEIVEIARCVVKALALAAEHGVVHRDIKPANIMISKTGLVKVMDFGLAKELDHNITQSGVVVGTPTYMSPEQGSGQTVDFRSDLYSLGCVLYEIVKGEPPFNADKVAAVIYKHMFELPLPLNSKDTQVDQLLEEFILKLLKKRPEDRYQTLDETLECLSQIYCNHAAAELSLAKHAQRLFKARKEKEAETPGIGLLNDPDAPRRMLSPHGEAPNPQQQFKNETVEALLPARKPSEPAAQPPAVPADPLTADPLTANPPVPSQRAKFLKVQKPNRQPSQTATPVETAAAAEAAVRITPATARPQEPPAPTITESSKNPRLPNLLVPPPKPLNMLKPPAKKESSNRKLEGSLRRPPSGKVPKPSSILDEAEVVNRETVAPVMRKQTRPDSVAPIFFKLSDGRWSYQKDADRCERAEGLAHEVAPIPLPSGAHRGLGDCLLCPNWNATLGCAVASNEELFVRGRLSGLKLLAEQATIWMGAGRHDKAIALFNEFVEDNPENPDGYRELARIYDRADYKGRDKRRGIIMYMRFIDLARALGNYSQIEIQRAEARAAALKSGNVSAGFLIPGEALEFDCFYRGASDCYVYCRANQDQLVAVKIGTVDPHTGNSEPDPSASTSTFKKAVSIFTRTKSDQEKQEEQSLVRKEHARLKYLDVAHVLRERNIICSLNFNALEPLEERASPPDLSILRLKEKSHAHNFIFTTRNAFEGRQLRELLLRRLTKR